jgi:hypothetical protein
VVAVEPEVLGINKTRHLMRALHTQSRLAAAVLAEVRLQQGQAVGCHQLLYLVTQLLRLPAVAVAAHQALGFLTEFLAVQVVAELGVQELMVQEIYQHQEVQARFLAQH